MSERGSVTRVTALAAVMAATMLLGLPAFITDAGNNGSFGAVGSAEAVDVDRKFTLGVGELTADSLNPNTATMVSEYLLIYYSYSYLWTYDVDANIIGDLATDWSVDPTGQIWWFKLVENAYFCDPDNPDDTSHRLTADDVAFTFQEVQDHSTSRLHFLFPDIIDHMVYTPGGFEITIYLNQYYAAIRDSWSGCPILPKYIWDSVHFINFDNLPPIGSGPLYYATDGLPTAGGAELKRNPTWFQTENKGWQLHTDTWLIKEILSPDAALIDLNSGALDCYLRLTPELYLTAINSPSYPNTAGFSQAAGFVYEYNLNQMTDALRDSLGGAFNAGENNQILLDPTVKMAMAMAVDKYAFVADETIMAGLGSYADSLVPGNNVQHYWIPDPIEFDLVGARNLLWNAGWQYDEFGNPATSTTCPLAKVGGTDVLSFRFATLDTSVVWENACIVLADWAREIGVELNLEIHTVSEMNTIWYSANYDVWLWDWVMGVLTDASGIMEVYTTGSIGASSDVYTSDPYYDNLYELSLSTVDPVARQEILNEMQEWAYWNLGCQCIAYSNDNYGVSTVNWDLDSLGDWNSSYLLLPDINCQWNSMQMYPNNNHAPQFTYYTGSSGVVETYEGGLTSFTATGNDDDPATPLQFRWFWGDGSSTAWSSSGSADHAYAEAGTYETWVAIKEAGSSNGFEDYFQTSAQLTVKVYGANSPPEDVTFTYEPSNPDAATYITFTGSATDPEDDPLYYTWDFGDGHSSTENPVVYQYGATGTFTVTLYVDDLQLGGGTRPVEYSEAVYVAPNYAPTISVSDFTDRLVDTSYTYTVTASDPEDALRYTWDWGDGSTSVTTVPSASHTYGVRSTYTLEVWADDLTGLDGHNVSDTGLVSVINPANHAPVISLFAVDDSTPSTWQDVLFTATASDEDGDAMTFTIQFGDGTNYVESVPINSGETIEVTATHAYSLAGGKTATLYVWDGLLTDSETEALMVSLNYPPVFLDPLEPISASVGELVTVTVVADDDDGDPLTYTFEWGDGSEDVTTESTMSHTYLAPLDGEYTVSLDDGMGHVVSESAAVVIEAATSFSLHLVVGWNLVAIPFVNHGYTAASMGLVYGEMMVSWDPATQTYDKTFYPQYPFTDFSLEPLTGYWISSTRDRTVELTGEIPTSSVARTITVPGAGGWVLVGVPSMEEGLMASDIVAMYSGAVSMVCSYNELTQTYTTYYPMYPFTDFALTVGEGLWVFCGASGVLTYEP